MSRPWKFEFKKYALKSTSVSGSLEQEKQNQDGGKKNRENIEGQSIISNFGGKKKIVKTSTVKGLSHLSQISSDTQRRRTY